MTAPKMTLAFRSAAPVTTSAASFTSNRPRSAGPVMLSRIPVAPSIDDSSSGELTAVRAASLARQTLVADSRIAELPDPAYREIGTLEALTFPNLGEFDEFRTVRFFHAGGQPEPTRRRES